MFITNQRRINIKLQSQNHVYKSPDNEEAEGLGGEEFKTEVEEAEKANAAYYQKAAVANEQLRT